MVTGTTPISQLPTGTIDALSAVFPLSIGMPSSPSSIRSTLAQTAQYLGINGFISDNAAQLTYITGTSYRVEAGSAIVNGEMLTWSSPITRSGLTFVSGTMNYVYLYNNAGTPAAEESTTVPAWDSTLQYWKKTGDSSRRCLGFLQASTTNSIRSFFNAVNGRNSEIIYIDGSVTGKQVVATSVSESAWTSISLSTIIPSHATHVALLMKIVSAAVGNDLIVALSPEDLGSAAANTSPNYVRAQTSLATGNIFLGATWNAMKTSQTYYYKTQRVAGSPTATIEAHGARFVR